MPGPTIRCFRLYRKVIQPLFHIGFAPVLESRKQYMGSGPAGSLRSCFQAQIVRLSTPLIIVPIRPATSTRGPHNSCLFTHFSWTEFTHNKFELKSGEIASAAAQRTAIFMRHESGTHVSMSSGHVGALNGPESANRVINFSRRKGIHFATCNFHNC